MKEWKLEDVETTNREYPNSFFIPTLDERTSQKEGALVRLHFQLNNPQENEPRAERMWVEISETKMFGQRYKGILTNQPACIKGLNIGDEIEFEAKNIAQIYIRKEDPMWSDIGDKKALVSKMCMEDNAVICWIYREEADRDIDSGWRVFSGEESEEYIDNPNNIRLVNVSYLFDKDPTLREVMKGEVGSAYEREDKDKPWEKVEI